MDTSESSATTSMDLSTVVTPVTISETVPDSTRKLESEKSDSSSVSKQRNLCSVVRTSPNMDTSESSASTSTDLSIVVTPVASSETVPDSTRNRKLESEKSDSSPASKRQKLCSVAATNSKDFRVICVGNIFTKQGLQIKPCDPSPVDDSYWFASCQCNSKFTLELRDPSSTTQKACQLPIVKGRFEDIPSISPKTVAKVLRGIYGGSFIIVDCRYPYEYNGGHIKGAKNFYTKKEMSEVLFPSNVQPGPKPTLIFHCEFSSIRGPAMYRFVRRKDEELNKGSDASLYYPKMYLLAGGYRVFYDTYKKHCHPKAYKKMTDEENIADFVRFYARSKVTDNEKSSRKEAMEEAMVIVKHHFPKTNF